MAGCDSVSMRVAGGREPLAELLRVRSFAYHTSTTLGSAVKNINSAWQRLPSCANLRLHLQSLPAAGSWER